MEARIGFRSILTKISTMSRFSTLNSSHKEYIESLENKNIKEKTSQDIKVLKQFLLHKNENSPGSS